MAFQRAANVYIRRVAFLEAMVLRLLQVGSRIIECMGGGRYRMADEIQSS